jgi:hypothetical protein
MLGGGQAQESLQKDPWSVYSWGLNSQNTYYPPSCHQLSYFSGSPLRFDLGGELAKWKPGSYTVETNVDLLGSSEGHRIYQVLQHISLKSQAGEQEPVYCSGDWPKIGMKRLLVERHPNEFCMIFEEEGTVEPPCGEIVRIEPAEFVNMGEPVLLTYDPLVSNGGYTIDGAWVFDHGVPICLLSTGTTYDSTLQALEDILAPAFKHILPPGCELKRSLNIIDLEHFRVLSALMPTDEGVDRSKCEGAVELELGIKNHKLVVEHERYRPQ